ncbi:MAG TPA: phosphoenolpyruvate carboxylase [Chloroflexota bacterium]|nr:phosphoenolpyruvate carboxylase [Chloroflexota bacterium]
MKAYRELVYENPAFLAYFRQATPLDQIAELRIGSRPSRRKASDRIEDLRAIPWVFSWTQNRHGLPGWFGLGTAVEAFIRGPAGHGTGAPGQPDGRPDGQPDGDGMALLKEMYARWPFFRSLVDNAQLSMGKADLAVARLYAGLVDDPAVRERIFGSVAAEWERTAAAVLAVTEQPALLGNMPVLRRSVRLRNPYVDPLSFAQVSLLRRLRRAKDAAGTAPQTATKGEVERLVALSINGVAAGLQNTG